MNKKFTKLLSVFIIAGAIGTGTVVGLAGCSNKEPEHTHTAATEWKSDATKHWHECTENDGAKLDEAAHDYTDDQDATCNTCGYERTITPAVVAVTGVTLDKSSATLKMGETESVTLVATVEPSNATNKNVTWSSDNTAVATVANGVVTAVSAGTANITVTTADGSKTASCAITVEAAPVVIDWEAALNFTKNTNYKLEQTSTEGEEEFKTIIERDGNKAKITQGDNVQYGGEIDGKYYVIYGEGESSDEMTEEEYLAGFSMLELFPEDKFAYDEAAGGYVNTESYNYYGSVISDVKVVFNKEGCVESASMKMTMSMMGVEVTMTVTTTVTYGGVEVVLPEINVDPQPEVNVREIATVADFLAFRQLDTLEGEYKLVADIDLAGVTLEAPKAKLEAGVIFNGQGHTIKNASYTDATAKTGILCASINGATVTNVKFLGCAVSSTNESAAILAGLVNGTSTLSKIEFNSCTVVSGNYGGLLFARQDSGAAVLTIEEITAKNGCSVQCAQYGGLLMGDMTNSTKVSFKNLDVAGELKGSSGNGSFLAGRTRGGGTSEVSVENAVLNVTVPAVASIGIFSGNGNLAKLTVKNVLITGSNISNLYQSTKAPGATDISGLYAVAGVTVDQATAGENTVAFLTDTLGLDFTATWVTEGEDNAKYRLAAASTNVKSADAVISEVKLSTSNVKARFKKGEDFTAEGLNVMGAYSDGVQLVLNAGEGYTVDSTAFNKDVAGSYEIIVKSVEDETKTATYTVIVVEEVGFEVIDNHMDHVYLVGDSLDTANLVVKSIWSDGVKEKLAAADYTIDATSFDMTTAGAYSVSIAHGTYDAQIVKISVLNSVPQVVDGKVYVNVSAAHDGVNGALVNGVETFKSVKDAINFYETVGYEADVIKVIYVGEGTYTDKITTALDNLVLIGEGTDKSVMTYSAVESTVDPVTGAMYGLKCATLQVNGTGFRAYNISIRNDFDYKNDNKKEASPQGLALTVNGDQAVLQNVYLYGNQDTLYLKSGRTYIKDSQIDGNIDFIFGEAKGLAYFDNCKIVAINKSNGQEANNGYVTAMKADATNKPDYGYIFANCEFTDDGTLLPGSMSLGRPWGAKATVAYISCSFSEAYSTAAYDGKTKSRWFDMSGNSPVNADFCEYNSTGAGAITEAVNGGRILTADEAANYTKANIFAATNGLCTWSAAWDCDAAVTALAALTGAKVAATELYASVAEISVEEGATAQLWLGVAPWNATDKEVTVTVADETVATWSNGVLTALKAGTTTITVSKEGLTSKTVAVTVTASTAPASTTYTYTHGGTNGSEWATSATATNSSQDATPVTGLKVLDTDSFSLTASGTKATITLNGFTTGTSKAAAYVTVTFKDAGGNSLGTLTGTTTAGKVVGDFTFTSDGVFTSETAFATVEISCNTAGKHFSIVSLSIVVE